MEITKDTSGPKHNGREYDDNAIRYDARDDAGKIVGTVLCPMPFSGSKFGVYLPSQAGLSLKTEHETLDAALDDLRSSVIA